MLNASFKTLILLLANDMVCFRIWLQEGNDKVIMLPDIPKEFQNNFPDFNTNILHFENTIKVIKKIKLIY